MAKFQTSIYLVTISAPDSGDGYIARLFEIGENRLRTAFGDSDGVGDVANSRIRIAT